MSAVFARLGEAFSTDEIPDVIVLLSIGLELLLLFYSIEFDDTVELRFCLSLLLLAF